MELQNIVHGPFADATADDSQANAPAVVTYKVKVRYRCGTREGVDHIPLYTVPLLMRKYELSQGRVDVSAEWPVNAKRPISRRLTMTSAEWSNELMVLAQQYTVAMPGGIQDIFTDVYGKNGEKMLKILPKQAKKFGELMDLCKEQGRMPSDSEVRDIAMMPLEGERSVRQLHMAQALRMDIEEPTENRHTVSADEDPTDDSVRPPINDKMTQAMVEAGVPESVADAVSALWHKTGKLNGADLVKDATIAKATKADDSLLKKIFDVVGKHNKAA
jgi:hypothetical protein